MVNSELWEHCGHDIEKIQSIGYASEVFLSGFFFPPHDALPDAAAHKPGESRQSSDRPFSKAMARARGGRTAFPVAHVGLT